MLAFEESEYRARVHAVRQRMAAEGLDALLCSHPANMGYLTGYDGWSFYVHQLVLVTASADEDPVWFGRAMDANAARVTTYLPKSQIVSYSDDYVQSESKHPLELVAGLLRDRGLEKGVIGAELDSFYFPARSLVTLQRELANARIADATKLVGWVRVVKSPAELAYIERAARICEGAMQRAVDAIDPANRQCDAAAETFRAMIAGTPEHGGDYPSIVPMLPSGEGTSTPHLTWTDAHFREGEATIVELAGCHRRYHCPMARTVYLGQPPKQLDDTAKVVVEGLNNTIDAAQPGTTAEEVEQAWRRIVERHGIRKESRLGYSVGLSYPPDWGEGTLSVRPGDRTELQQDMVLHLIAGIWMADWGVEISECTHVTQGGGRPLAEFERGLITKQP